MPSTRAKKPKEPKAPKVKKPRVPKAPKEPKKKNLCKMNDPNIDPVTGKVKKDRRKFGKKEKLLTIDVGLGAPDERAVNSHLSPKAFPYFTGKSLDAPDPKSIPCNPEAGKKKLAKGKLELAFMSEKQREKYNAANPDAPQIPRAGPVIRLCEAQKKPRLLPVEGFEDAYKKSVAFRKCVLKDGKSESACLTETITLSDGSDVRISEKGLALGRSPKKRSRKARR
jgi:hypothetical protein